MTILKGDTIPNGERLWKYCRPDALQNGIIPRSIFEDSELSCDWEKHREDPTTSFHIAEGKTEVIEITVTDEIKNPTNPKRTGQSVAAWKQEVIYDPLSDQDDPNHGANIAHSLIKGPKKQAITDAILKSSKRYLKP